MQIFYFFTAILTAANHHPDLYKFDNETWLSYVAPGCSQAGVGFTCELPATSKVLKKNTHTDQWDPVWFPAHTQFRANTNLGYQDEFEVRPAPGKFFIPDGTLLLEPIGFQTTEDLYATSEISAFKIGINAYGQFNVDFRLNFYFVIPDGRLTTILKRDTDTEAVDKNMLIGAKASSIRPVRGMAFKYSMSYTVDEAMTYKLVTGTDTETDTQMSTGEDS